MAAMSKEQSDALRTVLMYYATEAMKDARHLWDAPDEVVERELVPYWEKAIHTVWIKAGICSCPESRADPLPNEPCFMEMTRDERLVLFREGHPMSYGEFLEAFNMGRNMAFAELAGTAPKEDQ